MHPTEALTRARAAAAAGRHAEALRDLLWFHEHALDLEPSLYGLRLSFALGAWKDLADVYPPAMAELRAAKRRGEARCASIAMTCALRSRSCAAWATPPRQTLRSSGPLRWWSLRKRVRQCAATGCCCEARRLVRRGSSSLSSSTGTHVPPSLVVGDSGGMPWAVS